MPGAAQDLEETGRAGAWGVERDVGDAVAGMRTGAEVEVAGEAGSAVAILNMFV